RRLTAPPRRAWRGVDTGRERPEDRVEPFDDVALATDHHAVAAFEAEHAAARADVHVVDAGRCEHLGAVDVVAVVRVAAVDDDVVAVEQLHELINGVATNAAGTIIHAA